MKINKQMIRDTVSIDEWDIDGTPISELSDELMKKVPEGVKNPFISFEQIYDDLSIYIVYEREETDEEMKERIKQEQKMKELSEKSAAKVKEKELKELARLQKKYGVKT